MYYCLITSQKKTLTSSKVKLNKWKGIQTQSLGWWAGSWWARCESAYGWEKVGGNNEVVTANKKGKSPNSIWESSWRDAVGPGHWHMHYFSCFREKLLTTFILLMSSLSSTVSCPSRQVPTNRGGMGDLFDVLFQQMWMCASTLSVLVVTSRFPKRKEISKYLNSSVIIFFFFSAKSYSNSLQDLEINLLWDTLRGETSILSKSWEGS